MKWKRFFIASSAIFLFAVIWNGIVHLVILREADAILNTIGRGETERNMTLSLLATAALAVLFVWSYSRFARRGTLREGVTHGIFFGILAGVLVDLNQYVIYPVPAALAFSWFAFGLVEFCCYGILASTLYPVKQSPVD